jgi:hypothetical protein
MIEWKPDARHPNAERALVNEFELLVFRLAADPNKMGWGLYGPPDRHTLLASGEADGFDAAKVAAKQALLINDGSITDT